MNASINRQWILARRPRGFPAAECYEFRRSPVPRIGDGEMIVRNAYLSLDPAIRGWMDDVPSYMPPIPIGAPMRGTTIGKVVESRIPGFAVGDIVQGLNGWEDYSVVRAGGFTAKLPTGLGVPPTNFLSVLGPTGLTAYFGLLDVGRPKRGETVLVSGAAGAVGSIVGQIAKIEGCRAVGIAGGTEKCDWLRRECGYDAVIDYKARARGDFVAAIREACPDGVDIYFDNVGGPLLDAVLVSINERGRVLMCGAIAQYNATELPPGPRQLWQLIVRSARIEGFLVRSYLDRWAEGAGRMAGWLAEGRIRHREHIDKGLENATRSFERLFSGDHRGKLIVDIASEAL